jgi:predicted dehydrogenase
MSLGQAFLYALGVIATLVIGYYLVFVVADSAWTRGRQAWRHWWNDHERLGGVLFITFFVLVVTLVIWYAKNHGA